MFKLVSVLAVLLFGILFTTVRLTPFSQSADNDKPTQIKAGELTGKQKIHSKLFPQHTTGRKLPTLAETGAGDIVVVSKISPPFKKGVPGCPSYPNPELTGLAHAADVVLVGVLKGKSYSQLTEQEDFVFSNYDVLAEEVLKNSVNSPVQAGNLISIVRPGGTVELKGRIVRAVSGGFLPFTDDSRYLFFLKAVPETNSYQAFGSGTFVLRDGKAASLGKGLQTKQSSPEFVSEVRAAVTAPSCMRGFLY
jgi:hypothetical protein